MSRLLAFGCIVAGVGAFASASFAEEAASSRDDRWGTHRHQLGGGMGAGFTYSVRASITPGVSLDYAYGSPHVDVGAQLRIWGGLPVVATATAPSLTLHIHSHATDGLPVELRLNWGIGGLLMWSPETGHAFVGWQTSLGASVRWWITPRVGIELGPEGHLGRTNGQVNTDQNGSTTSVAFLGFCGWASAVYTL